MTELIEKKTLWSVLPPQVIVSQLDGGFIAEPSNKDDLINIWRQANKAYISSSILPARSYISDDDLQQIDIESLTGSKDLLNRISSYQPFDTHKFSLLKVRASKLVTPQIVINPNRAMKRLGERISIPSEKELLEFMLGEGGVANPISRQILGIMPNGGSLIYTSFDEDIRIYNPPQFRSLQINQDDNKSISLENICIPVGGGYPFASAYRVQIAPGVFRVILNNGIHRAYRLAELGLEWIPILVSDFNRMEFGPQFVDLPSQMLFDLNSNPPVITDFLNPEYVITLKFFPVLKTLRFNWNFEQYVTVLK